MTQDIVEETKLRMHQALERFKQDLRSLRTSRASSALIEGITVEVYGSQMRLKELGNITSPEARQLMVHPYDGANAQHIAKAIDKANLGLRTVMEGKDVRVFFPELDQNRRKELINQCHKKLEECKVAIRGIRRDQNEAVKKKKTASLVTEDDAKRCEKQIQDFTDKSCEEADKLSSTKEKEIATV
jgi:ribosome recycling factor